MNRTEVRINADANVDSSLEPLRGRKLQDIFVLDTKLSKLTRKARGRAVVCFRSLPY